LTALCLSKSRYYRFAIIKIPKSELVANVNDEMGKRNGDDGCRLGVTRPTDVLYIKMYLPIGTYVVCDGIRGRLKENVIRNT